MTGGWFGIQSKGFSINVAYVVVIVINIKVAYNGCGHCGRLL